MDNIRNVLGSNIRKLRKRTGWTQEYRAEKAGISVPFMTQIELGKKASSLEVIQSIAEALGVPYETLFKTSENMQQNSKYDLFILEQQLMDSIKTAVHTTIESAG